MQDDAEPAAAIHEALDPAATSPERFEPDADGGKLVHAEHIARYRWAAELAEGRTVLDAGCGTGYGSLVLAQAGAHRLVAIDASAEAVAQTQARLGERGEATRADARELPFADESFDLIVCFEVIEHIGGGDRALAEFARTLRPDGVLVISSPNPRRYLQGNPHHVHEYVPEELQAALGQHFAHVSLAAQRAWLGSFIAGQEQLHQLQDAEQNLISAALPGSDADAEGTYVLAAAGHGEAQLPAPRLVFGGAFEVKWWMEQVREREIVAARAQETEARLAALEARLVEVEQERARLLSERPQFERAVADLARAREVMTDLQESVSWKLTTPLRSGKQIVQRTRRPPQ
ncbi:MAG TPA: class I SAM-dependent methyltransferase [Solirubrobacteraceae bacterium]|jgi:ubiquinone/menaquinone biosynthesis C-methylase UbiE|nr:class I SAM-dependent methyltransferase [Solirubrobacteraceae bacterium]